MKDRISTKQGRHRRGIGKGQLFNVRTEQQIREVEKQLAEVRKRIKAREDDAALERFMSDADN